MVYVDEARLSRLAGGSIEMGGLVSERDLERLGVRQYGRLEIPLRAIKSVAAYREIADLLRGLATSIEVQSRRTDIPEKDRVIIVMHDISSTNRKIRDASTSRGDRKI